MNLSVMLWLPTRQNESRKRMYPTIEDEKRFKKDNSVILYVRSYVMYTLCTMQNSVHLILFCVLLKSIISFSNCYLL